MWEHHYRVDVFIVAIDSQLQELNNRFNESVSELLRLSVTLDPKKSFNADDICKLVTKLAHEKGWKLKCSVVFAASVG
ncbi:zinc finger MYM-type protein 1-like protein [Tanacetum coccineum]